MFKFNIQIIFAFFIITIIISIQSCGSSSETDNKNSEIKTKDWNKNNVVKINNRLFGVPSPFQTAATINNLKVPFNKDLLNPIKNQAKYITTFQQATNLGIYGADLSYLNIYDQLPDAGEYFEAIKLLSKELGILSSIDHETLKGIEKHKNNRDSLMLILSDMFRKTDTYLFNNDRNDVGLLILSGGWIESLYIMVETIQYEVKQEIIDRIGEQKQPLNNLIDLLSPYYEKVSPEFDNLLSQLTELATIFDNIQFEYAYKESKIDTINKLTHVNSERKCIITDDQLMQITKEIKIIRNKITK